MKSKKISGKKDRKTKSNKVLEFKKRMLVWDSPVEYVNNMYGCHPNDDNEEYFKKVFADHD